MDKKEKKKVILEVEPDTQVTIKPIAAKLAKKSTLSEEDINPTAGVRVTGTIDSQGHPDGDIEIDII